MPVTRWPNNTILIAGGHGPGAEGVLHINRYVCGSTSITPGDLIETYLANDGATKWRPHSSPTIMRSVFVALEATMQNKGIDDQYTENQLVEAAALHSGDIFYGRVPSGANISPEDFLQSNGNGMVKEATSSNASTNVAFAKAKLDAPGSVLVTTRLQVEII